MQQRILAGLVGALALVLVPGLALVAPASPQTPVFPAESALVTVDVVVLGPDGKPVSGLTRDDFVVKEDGRPQTLTAFEAVEAIVPGLVAPPTTSTPSAARVATNVSAPSTRRTFAIVFDDLHVGDINIEQAKKAVGAFVEKQTLPGDRLVLLTTSDARYWTTQRGPEDDAWREALRRVRSRQLREPLVGCQVTHYEAMRIEDLNDAVVASLVQRRLQRLCPEDRLKADAEAMVRASAPAGSGSSPAQDASPHEFKIAGRYAQARAQLAKSLRVTRELIRSLGASSGRKSLVLVTEGFPADTSLGLFREVREQAARANVAISFLDARGLALGPEFLSAAGTTALVPPQDVGPTLALWKLEDAGSKALAEETGGRVLQTNDLVSGLTTVADESRVTYLLGYEPTNGKRDGRYRKLKVEVRRPDLQVRARSGYFAASGKEKPAPKPTAAQRALRDLFDADGIPLRLAAYVMGPAPVQSPVPKTGVEVLIAGELRLDALETREKAGRLVAEPKLKLLVSSREGESHESDWTLEIALAPALSSANEVGAVAPPPVTRSDVWHPFLTRIAMAPGDHRARLVVESGGRAGSVTADFIVPDFTEERLSTPILSDRLVSRPGDRGVLPLARRSFASGATLYCWLELQGAAVEGTTGAARATARFVARGDGREWASGPATAMNLEAGHPTRLIALPLASAPPGESEIVLMVRDEVSGRTFEVREPFRVETPAPAEAKTPSS